ncbi:MAG TPA: type III-B CRISPR module RAMP protein Cmr1, partial [Planctomycetaceae bacterium]|nr:type III-B CRISPR module RAMP protein Cmr1 [Planctomycetaceae bacterium]
MTVFEATYRIVTPMFCAGADEQRAELRLPSFKGALRFWWRSLMWGQVKDH